MKHEVSRTGVRETTDAPVGTAHGAIVLDGLADGVGIEPDLGQQWLPLGKS